MVMPGDRPEKMIRRFKWIDNNNFKYITRGKVERKICIDENFREVSYNYVNSFSTENTDIKHYYDMPE